HFFWRARRYTARTKFGAVMTGQSKDFVQRYIYYFGVWEPNLTEFIRRRLAANPSRRTFVDVGANVGYFTLLASRLLPLGQVVAIEAFPSIYEELLRNIYLNNCSNIRAVPFAATERTEQLSMFYAGPLNEGRTTLVAGNHSSPPTLVEGKPLADL